jgi:hypothetical protein
MVEVRELLIYSCEDGMHLLGEFEFLSDEMEFLGD